MRLNIDETLKAILGLWTGLSLIQTIGCADADPAAAEACSAVCDCACQGDDGDCVNDCVRECGGVETVDQCMGLPGASDSGCRAECQATFSATGEDPIPEPRVEQASRENCATADGCDACDAPNALPPGLGTIHGTTSGATNTQRAWCGGGYSPEVAYSWKPALTGKATLSTCGSSFNTVLYVRATSCASPYDVACVDDGCPDGLGSRLTIDVFADTTYYIFVDGVGEQSGSYDLRVTPPGLPQGADTCEPAECGGSGGICFCDAECAEYGDCCDNACVACGAC